MATSTFSLPIDVSTAQLFNTFWSTYCTILENFGWVQTADTGQVNFTTNSTVPNVVTDTSKYRVYRMNDALASEYPVYMRLTFHCMTATFKYPGIGVQIGFGTDGAGNMVGSYTPSLVIHNVNGTGIATTEYTHFLTGASDRFCGIIGAALTSNLTSTTHGNMILVERSKDTAGNNTGEYVTLLAIGVIGGQSSTTVGRQVTLHRSYGATAVEERLGAVLPYNSTSGSYGIGGGTFPVFPMCGRLENPLCTVAVCKRNDFTFLSNSVVSLYGATRTFKVFSHTNNGSAFSQVVPAVAQDSAVLVLWE